MSTPFPELLYQLSERDLRLTWLDPTFARFDETSTTNPIVGTAIEVPDDRALILTAAVMSASPGAGQSVTNLDLLIVRPTPDAVTIDLADLDISAAPVADRPRKVNFSGAVLVPPGWRVRGQASFSAAAVANTVILTAMGVLIPPGNIQRV